MKKHISKGFTIIELLIVIAIIAILTGIIVSNLAGARAKSRDAQRVSDLGQIQLALSLYFDRCNEYPATITGDLTQIFNGCPTSGGVPVVTLFSYTSKIPVPLPNAGQTTYDYKTDDPSHPHDYFLHAILENPNGAVANGLPNTPSWYSAPPTINCSNDAAVSKDYCVGPK